MKPETYWAVYDPAGLFLLGTVAFTRREAWQNLAVMWGEEGQEPAEYRKRGYRCLRVTVTPAREGGA